MLYQKVKIKYGVGILIFKCYQMSVSLFGDQNEKKLTRIGNVEVRAVFYLVVAAKIGLPQSRQG